MKTLFLLCSIAVMICTSISAQQITEFRQPGDVIRLEIKFDGQDTAKITSVMLYLGARGNPLADQSGFREYMQSSRASATSPGKFIVEVQIPPDCATGDYALTVNAFADTGITRYVEGQQFNLPLFHVRNPKTFTPPHITVTLLNEKP
jgi:hypothetical protein